MSAKRTLDILTRVRALMKSNGPLQAYIVPWTDVHKSEYLAECDRQRAVLSGFTGSAGTAIVTEEQACLWTDGRYYLQALKEMDSNWTLMKESQPDTPTQSSWLCSSLPRGSTVAVDPSLITHGDWTSLHDHLTSAGHSLIPVPGGIGLVEQVWADRPPRPKNPVTLHPIAYTGRSTVDKLRDLRQMMAKNCTGALVITALDEVAWTLNMRGTDIPFNPVFFAFLIVTQESAHLFIESTKLSVDCTTYLQSPDVNVTVHPYEDVIKFVSALVPGDADKRARIWFGTTTNRALTSSVPETSVFVQTSPVALLKAIKNQTEADGMRQSHIRDGVAVCRYLSWLETVVKAGEKVTEASGASKLEKFRSEMDKYVGLSFQTISSVGPNGAIMHYTPSKEGSDSDVQITSDQLYLCDSGGQYLDGTTDITRTVHFGTPTHHERECYTRVLKGQLQLASAVFPEKIRGNCLDTLARKFLWDVGLDYQHGTSHGIGSYLCVHEGPMGISWRAYPDDPGLEAGMFLSNEPGYYEPGDFGIRLENIVHIVPAKVASSFLTFETVTFVPLQAKMIIKELLTEKEVGEVDEYHRLCKDKLTPLLQKAEHQDVIEWLNAHTKPL